jgi:hypothetical protein
LQLSCDEAWINRAAAAFEIKSGYAHESSLIAFYQRQVEKRFVEFPDFQLSLLKFCDAAASKPAGVAA